MNKLMLAPALLLGTLMIGCGSSSTTSSAPESAATSSGSSASSSAPATSPTTATSSASATAQSGSTASGSASSTAKEPSDVCALLSVAEVNKLAGTKYAAQSKGANRCTYTITKTATTSADDFGMLTGIKATTASLASLAASEKQSFGSGASSRSIDVKGTSEAVLVTGQDAGNNASSVLTERDGLLYLVVTGGKDSAATYTTAASKVMEALLAA